MKTLRPPEIEPTDVVLPSVGELAGSIGGTFTLDLAGNLPALSFSVDVFALNVSNTVFEPLPALATFEPLVPVIRPEDLAVPVLARIEVSSSGPVLVDAVTGIWGVGETADAAVVDFVRALRQHADVLHGMGDLSSSRELEVQRRYLDEHLFPAGASTSG